KPAMGCQVEVPSRLPSTMRPSRDEAGCQAREKRSVAPLAPARSMKPLVVAVALLPEVQLSDCLPAIGWAVESAMPETVQAERPDSKSSLQPPLRGGM